jgi:hypothetical protein
VDWGDPPSPRAVERGILEGAALVAAAALVALRAAAPPPPQHRVGRAGIRLAEIYVRCR